MSPWDRPWSRAASDDLAVTHDTADQFDEHRDAAAPCPAEPPVQGLLAVLAFDRENPPQAFFEQIGAIQPGVGLGDPGQLRALTFGEILGVFPQRIAGALEPAGPLVRATTRTNSSSARRTSSPTTDPLDFGASGPARLTVRIWGTAERAVVFETRTYSSRPST